MYSLVQCFKTFSLSHTYTKFFTFQFIIFTSCTSTPLYILPHSPSCHPISNTIVPKWFHLSSIFRWHLVLTSLSHLILTRTSWLQPKKGGLHFILSDNSGNYDFDIKVKCCRFVGYIKDMIDFGFLRFVFYFRIKEKEKNTFYINFYSTIFLQNYFFISLYLNWIIITDMCVIYNCFYL